MNTYNAIVFQFTLTKLHYTYRSGIPTFIRLNTTCVKKFFLLEFRYISCNKLIFDACFLFFRTCNLEQIH